MSEPIIGPNPMPCCGGEYGEHTKHCRKAPKPMTDRQECVLKSMSIEMLKRFQANNWREAMPFPTLAELICRAHRALDEMYANALIGSEQRALEHAADAANLAGLACLFAKA